MDGSPADVFTMSSSTSSPSSIVSRLDNQTNSSTDAIRLPTAEVLDYAEMVMLVLLIMIGIPLNLSSFIGSLRDGSSSKSSTASSESNTPSTASRTIRKQLRLARTTLQRSSALKIHLTAANLLVICLYGFSQLVWLCTYSWKGGDIVCRLVKFCDTFCFYATSNIVVCISLDRVYVTAHVDRPIRGSNRTSRLRTAGASFRTALIAAWTLAFVSSIPQVLVWHQLTPYAAEFPDWHQCVPIWIANETAGQRTESRYLEKLYSTSHLLLVFWLPLLIIMFSYVIIIVRFREKIMSSLRDTRQQEKASNALLFQKRANSYHRRSHPSRQSAEPDQQTTAAVVVVSVAAGSAAATATVLASNGDSSMIACQQRMSGPDASTAGRLAAVPIVVNCSQAFLCQPLKLSTAVKTLTRAQARTIRTAFWIVIAYVVCWSPYNALVLWRFIDVEFDSRVLEFSANFIVLNAVLNPLIYRIR